MEKKKRKTITVKVPMKTVEKVTDLCVFYGVDQSKIIRTLIDTEHEKIEVFKNLAEKNKKRVDIESRY